MLASSLLYTAQAFSMVCVLCRSISQYLLVYCKIILVAVSVIRPGKLFVAVKALRLLSCVTIVTI